MADNCFLLVRPRSHREGLHDTWTFSPKGEMVTVTFRSPRLWTDTVVEEQIVPVEKARDIWRSLIEKGWTQF